MREVSHRVRIDAAEPQDGGVGVGGGDQVVAVAGDQLDEVEQCAVGVGDVIDDDQRPTGPFRPAHVRIATQQVDCSAHQLGRVVRRWLGQGCDLGILMGKGRSRRPQGTVVDSGQPGELLR